MEAGPEKIKTLEKIASMSVDDYLEAIVEFDLLDGKIPKDVAHAFYIWLSREPEFRDIDGASLVELYEKNVIETGMTQARFFQWCKDFNFPYPVDQEDRVTAEGTRFNTTFLAHEDERRSALYESWAAAHDINCSEGAIMQFADAEGTMCRVRTDTENRGEIIVD